LTDLGRLVVADLLQLPLTGIYVAVDQLQLTCRDAQGWNSEVHDAVLDAVRAGLGQELTAVEVPWRVVLSPPHDASSSG
jgi:hypothetical protein